MALGASRPNRSRQAAVIGLLAAIALISASGCGVVAYPTAPHETLQLVASRAPLTSNVDSALEGVVVAYGNPSVAEDAPPKFEMAAGITSIFVGDKLAGTNAPAGTPIPIPWDEAFEHTFGFDAQIVLRRPPRSLASLEAGDTFLLLRVSVDTYTGLAADVDGLGATSTFSDMSVTTGWLDGKTVFNPLSKTGMVRPYLQYGGGLASMDGVTRTDTAVPTTDSCWAPTMALAFHMGIGLEMRFGSAMGIYLEAGIQNIRKPNLDTGATPDKQAQDLLVYPLRLGVLFAF